MARFFGVGLGFFNGKIDEVVGVNVNGTAREQYRLIWGATKLARVITFYGLTSFYSFGDAYLVIGGRAIWGITSGRLRDNEK